MKGKIFVHIGLPKTATTTLQADFLPRIAEGNIEYLGVCQPRESKEQQKVYQKFMAATRSGKDLPDLRSLLEHRMESGKTLILSEEMILVSTQKATWREKLANLKAILEGYNYELIVTVREPAAALFSYYCEMYPQLGNLRHSFTECALHHEAMQIFHYKKLVSELFRHFEVKRIHGYKFEDLVAGDARGLAGLLTDGQIVNFEFSLSHHNQRSSSAKDVLTRHSYTVLDWIENRFSSLPQPGKESASKTMTCLRRLAKHVKLGPIRIPIPNPSEMRLLREALREDNQFLDEKFQLKYAH